MYPGAILNGLAWSFLRGEISQLASRGSICWEDDELDIFIQTIIQYFQQINLGIVYKIWTNKIGQQNW